jgi:hypothetical protein
VYRLVTTTENAPHPKVLVRDGLDVNLTVLIALIDEKCKELSCSIERDHKDCRTPRRNANTESYMKTMQSVEKWASLVLSYFTSVVFPVQTNHGLDLESLNDGAVFVAALSLFNPLAGASLFNLQQNKTLGVQVELLVLPDEEELVSLLVQQKQSLQHKLFEDLQKVFPENENLISVAEARLVVAASALLRLSYFLEAGAGQTQIEVVVVGFGLTIF